MGALTLVRHGQAAFGTDDYDRLTELGWQQARWLGEHFAERGRGFDRVYTGTLRRHRETWQGIAETAGYAQAPEVRPGLNEYQAELLLAAHLPPERLREAKQSADRRAHFRLLREALAAWADGALSAPGHLPYEAFVAGVRAVLDEARAGGAEQVLVVSSGGPISAALGTVLGLSPRMVVEMNLQARNSGVTEFRFNARAIHCVSFNNIPHLERNDRAHAVTYS